MVAEFEHLSIKISQPPLQAMNGIHQYGQYVPPNTFVLTARQAVGKLVGATGVQYP